MVSAGCTNCYAMRLAGGRLRDHPSRAGLTRETPTGPVWTGDIRWNEQWVDQPLQWGRPRRIFVCAHSDLFHERVKDEMLDRLFDIMTDPKCRHHQFQILTKRPERMAHYIHHRLARLGGDFDYPNIWLGTSAEDQETADLRIPRLLETPAAVRWVSCEPLLGPLHLHLLRYDGITNIDALHGRHGIHFGATCAKLDWVVIGGESGPHARPMEHVWAEHLIGHCLAAHVPVFMKQLSSVAPVDAPNQPHYKDFESFPSRLQVRQWPAE